MKAMAEKKFVPLYKKTYLDIKRRIEEREFAPGERLPYERELCEQYGVERVTVRKALDLLKADGLIEKRTGVGSFVSGGRPQTAPEGDAVILFVMRENANDIRHNTMSCNTKIFFAMEAICRRNGYLLSYVGFNDETKLTDIAREHAVAGIFLVCSCQSPTVQELCKLKIPTVLVNNYDPDLLSVMPDNMGMLKLVVGHLAQMGHSRIAYIDGMPDSCNAQERWEGFRCAMHLNGLAPDPDLYFVGNWTLEGGKQAARELLSRDELPTAVFAASDMMAAGAMEEIKRAGLRIPEDISVVGYDNLDVDALLFPALSSATIDFTQMSEVAFERLCAIMKNGDRDMDRYAIRMPARLIRRSSVGCPKRKD